MMRRWYYCWLLLLLGVVQPLFADDPLYEVEIIVFTRLDADALRQERWPLDPGLPNFNPEFAVTTELPKSRWRLQDVRQKLSRQSDYRILLHTAWTQPILEKGQPVYLNAGQSFGTDPERFPNFSGKTGNYELEGLFTLYKGKFFHATADFILQAPATESRPEDNAIPGSHRLRNLVDITRFEPDNTTQLQSFGLHQDQKIRSKTLYYVDHPIMGILFLVTPSTT